VARLHEYQGKALLAQHGIAIPDGQVVHSVGEARALFETLQLPVVIKAQAWVTGRLSRGLVAFAATLEEAIDSVDSMLSKTVSNFPVTSVLIEHKLNISHEYFASIIINDAVKQPELLFASIGGSGIEEIAAKHPKAVSRFPINLTEGLREYHARNLLRRTGVTGIQQRQVASSLVRLWQTARKYEARSLEVNPLVVTEDGRCIAADCRITIDDYAVYRHKELGIEVAREFDHPPTPLEKIAYAVEEHDYRGTFYFIQLEQSTGAGNHGVGFHGAGGGGSMMSMDAVRNRGFIPANFTDTSGNPPASKVYRAARIILSQPQLVGYFGSGSGVASQEQVNSARGLVKAFREVAPLIPAVIRLGGNMEDEAVRILTEQTADLPGIVEAYKKDDSVDFCAERFASLVEQNTAGAVPANTEYTAKNILDSAREPYEFTTVTGRVYFDHAQCRDCSNTVCISACSAEILKIESGIPLLAIDQETAAKGRCTECLACELACWFSGNRGVTVDLPIPGLAEYQQDNPVEAVDEYSD